MRQKMTVALLACIMMSGGAALSAAGPATDQGLPKSEPPPVERGQSVFDRRPERRAPAVGGTASGQTAVGRTLGWQHAYGWRGWDLPSWPDLRFPADERRDLSRDGPRPDWRDRDRVTGWGSGFARATL